MTNSEYIKIKTKDNKEFAGYLSKPSAQKAPGLLLIQEIFGVNSHIRDVADLYAQDGFVVLAPDLFWRQETGVELSYDEQSFNKGFELATKLDLKTALTDLSAAVDTLKQLPIINGKVGCIGYCFGGQLSYRLTCRNKVDAGVAYYGGGIDQNLDESETLNTPLLLHFAGIDKYIPIESIEKILDCLQNKKDVIAHIYPDVHHGFNCDQRSAYNRQAAMLAFARSSAFLHKYLGQS